MQTVVDSMEEAMQDLKDANLETDCGKIDEGKKMLVAFQRQVADGQTLFGRMKDQLTTAREERRTRRPRTE